MTSADASWHEALSRRIEEASPTTLSIWYLGLAGLLIRTPQAILMVDPYFGGSADVDTLRMLMVPMDPHKIHRCDAILSTHNHLDHCHKETILPILQNGGGKLIGPSSSIEEGRGWGLGDDTLIELAAGEEHRVHDVVARSWAANDPLEPHAISFLLEWGGVRLFHSGDSHPCEAFETLGDEDSVDVAFLNFGGGNDHWYMTSTELLSMASSLQARLVVPMHWDAWRRALPRIEDIWRLREAGRWVRFMVMGDGLSLDREGRIVE